MINSEAIDYNSKENLSTLFIGHKPAGGHAKQAAPGYGREDGEARDRRRPVRLPHILWRLQQAKHLRSYSLLVLT